jgi:hypothetical protein
MSKARLLVFVVSVTALVSLLCFVVVESQPPSLRVGSTLKDPAGYFFDKIRTLRTDTFFRHTGCVVVGDVVVWRTDLGWMPDSVVSRSCAYYFDTNGTLTKIVSHWDF